jgi:hypothetical protein
LAEVAEVTPAGVVWPTAHEAQLIAPVLPPNFPAGQL